MLKLENIYKTFNPDTINEKKALNGVNLHLKSGDFVTIIGGNGAGKSTLLNMIAGVYMSDKGSIILSGEADREAYKIFIKKVLSLVKDVHFNSILMYS